MTYRKKQDWIALFEQHHKSGLSAAEFCRRQGVCDRYFSKRKRELDWSPVLKKSAPFVKLTTAQPQTSHAELTLKAGQLELSLNTSVSPQWLAQLMKAFA